MIGIAPTTSREVIVLLRRELLTSVRDLRIDDVTHVYPWVTQHRLFLGTTVRGATLTVAKSGQAPRGGRGIVERVRRCLAHHLDLQGSRGPRWLVSHE